MALKWKILKAVSYIHLAAAVVLIFLYFYLRWPLRFNDTFDMGMFCFMIIIIIISIAYSLLHLYLLERKLPARTFSKPHNTWGNVLSVFFYLAFLIYLIASVGAAVQRVKASYETPSIYIMPLILFGTLVISGIPLLWLPVKLRRTIKRNEKLKFESFLVEDQP